LIERVPSNIEPALIFVSPVESVYGLRAETAGWGILNNPNALTVANVDIMTKEDCELRVSKIAQKNIQSDERIICSIALLHQVNYLSYIQTKCYIYTNCTNVIF
jgi:hypothetical protein